jgi:hypothetical protein
VGTLGARSLEQPPLIPEALSIFCCPGKAGRQLPYTGVTQALERGLELLSRWVGPLLKMSQKSEQVPSPLPEAVEST